MMKTKPILRTVSLVLVSSVLTLATGAFAAPVVPVADMIKAYDIDFNWGPGGPNLPFIIGDLPECPNPTGGFFSDLAKSTIFSPHDEPRSRMLRDGTLGHSNGL